VPELAVSERVDPAVELELRRARLVELELIVRAEVALELPLGLLVEREPLDLAVAEQVHDPGVE